MIFIHTFSINKIRRRLRKNNGAAIWKSNNNKKNRTTYAYLTLKKKNLKEDFSEKIKSATCFSCLVIKYEKAPTNSYLKVIFLKQINVF